MIKRTLYSLFQKSKLIFKNIKFGKHTIFYGAPIIDTVSNNFSHPSIIIGNNVVLCSSNSGNPIGINHPIILKTLTMESQINIGNNSGLSGTSICSAKSITIGKNCLIGANVTITDYDFHAISPVNRRYNTNKNDIGCAPVVIEDNVWLGMNVIVLKGVTIGRNSIIAAGSVVTKSISRNSIAGGNPARIIRPI